MGMMTRISRSQYICSRCLSNLRPARTVSRSHKNSYTTSSTSPVLPPNAAFARLTTRRLIALYGPDAPKYLQGLVAANMKPASPGVQQPGFYTAFLNAAGRVLYDVFIYPTTHSKDWRSRAPKTGEDQIGYLIEVDSAEVVELAKHLKRYKLRAKVDIRVIEDQEWNVFSAWGGQSSQHDLGGADDRIPEAVMGNRIVLPYASKPELDMEEVDSLSYNLRRMTLGVAEGQQEIIHGSALPQESNIDYMRGIDFRKGCYVGQELTIRTHHTGVVRKRILPVQFYDPSDESSSATFIDEPKYNSQIKVHVPSSGANISRRQKKGRSAGKFLTGIGNIGLALCRLEVMTDQRPPTEKFPIDQEDEFAIAWDEGAGSSRTARVKAFVPAWHKVRAEEQRVQRPKA